MSSAPHLDDDGLVDAQLAQLGDGLGLARGLGLGPCLVGGVADGAVPFELGLEPAVVVALEGQAVAIGGALKISAVGNVD